MVSNPMPRRSLLGMVALAAGAAHGAEVGGISVTRPWSRAAGANGTGAGFLTIRNDGGAPDRLVSATSPVARSVELHAHVHEGDVMRMRPVAGVALPPGEAVTLQPGGLHVMLIGLKEPLVRGTEVPVTLRFETAGEITVMLHVEAAGARGPSR